MRLDDVTLNFQPDRLWMLNAVIALIMFGVALDLRVDDFTRLVRSPRGPLIGLAAQFLVLPALTFLLTLIIRPAPSIALGMMLVAACPGGNLSNFLTNMAGGNTALSVTMSAISTAAATVMTPLNVAFWGSLQPDTAPILAEVHIGFTQLAATVGMILGVPLALGMACAHLLPSLARRFHLPMKYFSIIFFLGFVALIFAQNWEVFTRYIHWVAGAVVIHNACALGIGYTAARLGGLTPRDCRAVSFEVGIQNSALGLTLIFGFFAGLGGMALVAGAWGIWHIVSGLSLAWFWSRRPLTVVAPEAAG